MYSDNWLNSYQPNVLRKTVIYGKVNGWHHVVGQTKSRKCKKDPDS
jgi:hypothetical protein